MRFTAVFAVTLVAALFTVDGSVSAVPLPTNNTAFINELLMQEGGVIKPQVASAATDTDDAPVSEPTEPAIETPAPVEEPKDVIITIQRGDSLSKIAREHNTTWVRLYDANESITDPNVINPGQELRIPRADEELTSRALPQPKPAASITTTRRTTAPATSYPVSANAAKAFIYARESGNNPNATNPSGCYGLGQDCNGVLRTMCGADYACQDAFFDRYAAARYGSWEAAYAFWQANHWW